MDSEATTGAVGSVFQDQHGEDVPLESAPVSTTYEMSVDAVRDTDIAELVFQLTQAAAQLEEGLVKRLITTLQTVTAATGNVMDVEGQPISHEMLMDMYERIEWSLDADGELSMPSLMLNPETVKKLQELDPPTPEQTARLDDIKRRKLEELLARRRYRRLS